MAEVNLAEIKFGGAVGDRQTSKLNSPPNFPAIRYIIKTEKTFKNEQRSKDAAAKKRPNTSGVGKINKYYEDIYIPPYNNTD